MCADFPTSVQWRLKVEDGLHRDPHARPGTSLWSEEACTVRLPDPNRVKSELSVAERGRRSLGHERTGRLPLLFVYLLIVVVVVVVHVVSVVLVAAALILLLPNLYGLCSVAEKGLIALSVLVVLPHNVWLGFYPGPPRVSKSPLLV